MNKTILTLLFVLIATSAQAQTVAFVDVNVVPMDRERVLSHLKGKYYTEMEMNQWLDEIAPRFQHAMDGSH